MKQIVTNINANRITTSTFFTLDIDTSYTDGRRVEWLPFVFNEINVSGGMLRGDISGNVYDSNDTYLGTTRGYITFVNYGYTHVEIGLQYDVYAYFTGEFTLTLSDGEQYVPVSSNFIPLGKSLKAYNGTIAVDLTAGDGISISNNSLSQPEVPYSINVSIDSNSSLQFKNGSISFPLFTRKYWKFTNMDST